MINTKQAPANIHKHKNKCIGDVIDNVNFSLLKKNLHETHLKINI